MLTIARREHSFSAEMLAMADRLFAEFDHLAPAHVFSAIAAAHRDAGHARTVPSVVEALARAHLAEVPS